MRLGEREMSSVRVVGLISLLAVTCGLASCARDISQPGQDAESVTTPYVGSSRGFAFPVGTNGPDTSETVIRWWIVAPQTRGNVFDETIVHSDLDGSKIVLIPPPCRTDARMQVTLDGKQRGIKVDTEGEVITDPDSDSARDTHDLLVEVMSPPCQSPDGSTIYGGILLNPAPPG